VASPRRLALFCALVVPCLLALNFAPLPFSVPRLRALSGGYGLLDLELHYGATRAYEMLAAYGEQGRRLYLIGLATVDLILPAAMATLLAMALTLAGARRLAWLPFAMALADYLENACLMVLLARYPSQLPRLAATAGWLTSAKQALFVASLLTLLLTAARRMIPRTAREPANTL